MKRNFKLFVVVFAAAFAMAACKKTESLIEDGGIKTVNFTAGPIETKTVFGPKAGDSYPTLWTPGDLKMSLNFDVSVDAAIIPSQNQVTSSFSASFRNIKKGPYTFYSLSPKSAFVNISSRYKSYTINIPVEQVPTSSSVDEKAQIIWAKSAAMPAFPSEIGLQFKHVAAYGKLDLVNLDLGGRTITSISLKASKKWVGQYYLYVENNDGHQAGTLQESNPSYSAITINTSSSSGIWFACAPVDLGGGTIMVRVNTNNGIFEKTINIPAGKKFEAGKVAKFSVDMAGISPTANVVYNLVNSTNELTVGSEVMVVAASENKVMGEQGTNNRNAVTVSKKNNSITNPPLDVQIFTLQKGKKNNTAAFHCAEGYIYAASSTANHLKTEVALTDNSSWKIEIIGSGTTVVAQGTSTRKNLEYNPKNDIFSAYNKYSQKPVVIYKKAGTGTSEKIFN